MTVERFPKRPTLGGMGRLRGPSGRSSLRGLGESERRMAAHLVLGRVAWDATPSEPRERTVSSFLAEIAD